MSMIAAIRRGHRYVIATLRYSGETTTVESHLGDSVTERVRTPIPWSWSESTERPSDATHRLRIERV
jgi:hypothetical protein